MYHLYTPFLSDLESLNYGTILNAYRSSNGYCISYYLGISKMVLLLYFYRMRSTLPNKELGNT